MIEIRFTEEDVRYLAEEAGVPLDVAMARAEEWAKAITDTAVSLINEQMASVIEIGQP